MNYRTQINQALKTMLLERTPAGDRVYTALDRPLNPASDFPAIVIYTMDARRNPQDYGRSLVSRTVKIGIEAGVIGDEVTALPTVEEFADLIEGLLEADTTILNVATDSRWMSTITDTTSAGERTLGIALIEYEVDIFTHLRNPDTQDDGFDGVPTVVYSVPDATKPLGGRPLPPVQEDTACGENGCDLPAWGGEVVK